MRSLFFWKSPSPRTKAKPIRRRLEFEALEAREVPTITSGQVHVNTTSVGHQVESASDSTAGGLKIVVWTHRNANGNTDIRGQFYGPTGNKITNEIKIASTSKDETQPTVAIDDAGYVKVAWTETTSSTNKNVMAASFDGTGNRLRANFAVADGSVNEHDPSIGVAADGSFVVSFTRDTGSGNQDVFARMFRHNGTMFRQILVSNQTVDNESRSSVARNVAAPGNTNSGIFDIAYEFDGNIALKRYSAAGDVIKAHVIADGSRTQTNPSVSMDRAGRSVLVWQEGIGNNFDVYARQIGTAGSVGAKLSIAVAGPSEKNPVVAMDPSGNFVVAYQRDGYIVVQEMLANGKRAADPRAVVTGSQGQPALCMDGSGQYFVTYTMFDYLGDAGYGIFGRFGKLTTRPPTR